MIAILYNFNGHYIGFNSQLTEEDDIQLPHFFVDEVPPELLDIPEKHAAKIDLNTHRITYEVIPIEPDVELSLEERIVALEQQLTDTQMALTESYESNLVDKEKISQLHLALTAVYEKLMVNTGGNSDG